MKTPYEELGVDSSISMDELKKVYRSLCRKHHPDNGGDADKFAKINKAYDLIVSGKANTSSVPKRDTVVHDGLFKYKLKVA